MGGLPIVGSVRRTVNDFVGQSIDLKVLGTPEALDSVETKLLQENKNKNLWKWRRVESVEWESLPDNKQFVILPSAYGATRGADSDEAYD
jgi:hypothetical protein